MNLQQLKAKYATKETAATTASVTPETTATSYDAGRMPGFFGRAARMTAQATVAVAKTTRGVMPVTTRRFENIVEGLNDKHENTDRELFKNKVMLHMIASATGVNLPTDEELDVLYEEYVEEEEVAKEVEATKEVVVQEVAKEEVVVKEEVIVEEEKEVAATEQEETKAPTTGRRRLGRQKPIAE